MAEQNRIQNKSTGRLITAGLARHFFSTPTLFNEKKLTVIFSFIQHLVNFQLFLRLFHHFLREAEVQLFRSERRQALTEFGQHVVPQFHIALRRVFS